MGAYTALILGTPGQPKCPDKPNEESTLLCPNCNRLILQVAVNSILIEFGRMRETGKGKGATLGSIQWQTPEPYFPVSASLSRDFDAIRIRNFEAGKEAQVFATPVVI